CRFRRSDDVRAGVRIWRRDGRVLHPLSAPDRASRAVRGIWHGRVLDVDVPVRAILGDAPRHLARHHGVSGRAGSCRGPPSFLGGAEAAARARATVIRGRAAIERGVTPLRVLHVSAYFAPAFGYGGPPRSIHGLCKALASIDVDVDVVSTTANGHDAPLP